MKECKDETKNIVKERLAAKVAVLEPQSQATVFEKVANIKRKEKKAVEAIKTPKKS